MNPFKQTRTIISAVILIIMSGSLIASAALSPLTPPPTGGYDVGMNSILDPGCTPGATDCFVKSAWTLNGNTGTNPATQFIGTTDAQDLVFKTNNTERMRIFTSGNVGIGTTTDAGYKLDVNGTARISGGANPGLLVVAEGNNFADITVSHYGANGLNYAPSQSIIHGRGTAASPAALQTGDRIGSWQFAGYKTGSALGWSAVIAAMATENWTNTTAGAALLFETAPNGGGGRLERMRINNTGNVLIGTTTDAGYKLDVNGSVNFKAPGATASDTAFRVRNSADTDDLFKINGQGHILVRTVNNNQIYFGNSNTDNAHPSYYSVVVMGFSNVNRGYRTTIVGSENTFTGYQFGTILGTRNTMSDQGIVIGDSNSTQSGITVGNSNINKGGSSAILLGNGNIVSETNGYPITPFVVIGSNINVPNSININNSIYFGTRDTLGIPHAVLKHDNFMIGSMYPTLSNYDQNSRGVFYTKNGTVPTTIPVDSIALYSADVVAGNAAPHFRTENGTIMMLSEKFGTKSNTALSFATNDTEAMRIFTNQNIAIGTTTDAGYKLDVNGTARILSNLQVGSSAITSGTSVARFENAGGTCTVTPNTAGGITCTSDINYKKDITDVSNPDILSKLTSLDVKSYRMTADTESSEKQIGFIAQNVETLFPHLVQTDTDGRKSVSYAGFAPVITSAIKELNLKIDTAILSSGNTTSTGFFDALKSWLGSASNGLEKLFAREVHTDKLCVGQTCLDENQIKQILQSQGISGSSTSDNTQGTSGSDTVTHTTGGATGGSAGTDTADTTDSVTPPSDTPSDMATDQTPDSSGSDTVPVTDTSSDTTMISETVPTE